MEDVENVDVSENMPQESKSDEGTTKKHRRRSSIGADILATMMADEEMNRITTPEQKFGRPRRFPRRPPDYLAAAAAANRRMGPRKFVFDVGERANVRSCLRSGQNSKTTDLAKKIVKKYRRSASITPKSKASREKLRFASVCTIRVITPRPDYDPDNLQFPEEDEINPERERLSTVDLDITPDSQEWLKSIQANVETVDKVEFRAHMIFGDGGDDVRTAVEVGEPVSTTKRKRRKSLIVGSFVSPKSMEKTEAPVTEQVKEEKKEAPKSNCRRSLRFVKQDSPPVEPSPTTEIVVEKSKKRERVVKENSPTTEPERKKKDRRKSRIFEKDEDGLEIVEKPGSSKKDEEPTKKATTPPLEVIRSASDESISLINRRRSTKIVFGQEKKVEEPPKKMFAIFSPKPEKKKEVEAPKVVESPSVPTKSTSYASFFSPRIKKDVVKSGDVIIIDGSAPNTPTESTSTTSSGRKRKEKEWGDYISPTYTYLEGMRVMEPVMDDGRVFEKNWFATKRVDSTSMDPATSDFPFSIIMDRKYDIGELLPRSEQQNEPAANETQCPLIYKPDKMDELVEGQHDMETARKWLRKWKNRVRKEVEMVEEKKTNKKKRGRRKKGDDDSEDDEYVMDEFEEEGLPNPLVLIGPTGVGKTAFIRAMAKEQNMKLLVVGPNEERKGPTLNGKLSEAIQSHRLSKKPEPPGGLMTFLNNQMISYPKKKPVENIQTLVVIEHVDLFLGEYDKGGLAQLIELTKISKVPMVWTCEEDYPRDEELRPLKIYLDRNEKATRKYCQKFIEKCTNVRIDKSVMKQLATSVNHDLRGLIRQSQFYAISPSRPLPLTSRRMISSGFEIDWNIEKTNDDKKIGLVDHEDRKWNRMENIVNKYEEVIKDVKDGMMKMEWKDIGRIWDEEEHELRDKMSTYQHQVDKGWKALKARYSRKSMNLDVLPILSQIDQVEIGRKAVARRHHHRFDKYEEQPSCQIDADALKSCLGKIRSLEN